MERYKKKIQTKYQNIPDSFSSVKEVQEALRRAGLESCNIIVGIDYTSSNQWTGKKSFGGKSLHEIGSTQNPYEQALSIIGRTMEVFDEDKEVICFGFGDETTRDKSVFHFNPDGKPCSSFEDAIARYKQITPHVKLAGPTSFAPIIEAAVRIVEESGGQFHVLVIIADGQMTRPADTSVTQLSPQEQATLDVIIGASNFALAIVLIGVGDGPWDTMHLLDDSIRNRNFDNFQFVDFSSIMSVQGDQRTKEMSFALAALMEIPFQYQAVLDLGICDRYIGRIPPEKPLPPPPSVLTADAKQFGEYLRSASINSTEGAGLLGGKQLLNRR